MLLEAWSAFYAELSRGVEEVAYESGWTVLASNTNRDPVRELRNLDLFESNQVQGVLIVPQGDVSMRLRELRQAGMSSVMIEESDPPSDIPSVAVNDHIGGSIAAEHLLKSGRRRLAFVGNPEQVRHVDERWQGFSATVDGWGERPPREIWTQDLTMRAGVQAAQTLFEASPSDRPDGVFAANDLVALGILQACLHRGVRVPDDVALVGFDDIEFAEGAAIPLTTVRQPAQELGRTAAEMLIEDMTHDDHKPARHVVFEPTLVVRQSAP